jgi:hypothetical protein
MMWSIHYKYHGVAGYRSVSTFDIAIKQARALLDDGAEISEIASSGGNKSLFAEEIRVMCAREVPPAS